MQLKRETGGTKLMVTEQGAFLDGYDDTGSRQHGSVPAAPDRRFVERVAAGSSASPLHDFTSR